MLINSWKGEEKKNITSRLTLLIVGSVLFCVGSLLSYTGDDVTIPIRLPIRHSGNDYNFGKHSTFCTAHGLKCNERIQKGSF